MTTYREIEKILQTYTFQEVLEINELTEEDVLLFLVEEEFLELPEPKPIDYYDQD